MTDEPRRWPAVPVWVVAVVNAAIAAAGIVVVGVRLAGGAGAPAAVAPPVPTLPTTIPYSPRPGPKGTRILTEVVDPLAVAVPKDWKALSSDPITLPGQLDAFAAEAPSLAELVRGMSKLSAKGGVRLFAYRATPPYAFVSVFSYASPDAIALTPESAEAVAAYAKKPQTVAVSAVALRVAEAVKFLSSPTVGGQHTVDELLLFVANGRTVLVEMATEVTSAGIPPLLDQLAGSLSQK